MRFVRLTIRQRLPLYISASALVILLLEGFIIYESSKRFYEQEFRARIQERLAVADSIIARDRQHPYIALETMPPGSLPDETILYAPYPNLIQMPNGNRLLPQLVDTTRLDQWPISFAHLGLRDYGIRHDATTHNTLVISAIDRYGQSKIRNLRNGLIFGIIFGVICLALVSWFWVKKMLQPVADKINKARVIGTKSLNLRLNVKNNHDELGLLALTFNEMLDRIEQGFRAQQQFIRNASHEMRTPLTTITAEADLALQQSRSPEEYQQALENVRTQAESLNELVAQLLILAKVDASSHFSDGICAADEILLQAILALQTKYSGANAAPLQLDIDAPNPAQLLVHCDPMMLQTAFFNLLDNAVKYGNKQEVQVRLFPVAERVVLEIRDHGQGIDPQELHHLFKPFYRAKASSHIPGSGIGLSLVKSIAEKYGGSIQLQSTPGNGTTARLEFPCTGAAAP